ncbi:hypothetical protein ACP275_14G023300 [Erythranthe tilingii]
MEVDKDNKSHLLLDDDCESMSTVTHDLSRMSIACRQATTKIRFQDYAYSSYNSKAFCKKINERISRMKWDRDKAFDEMMKAVTVGLVRGNISEDETEKMACGGGGEIVRLATAFGIQIRKNSNEKTACDSDALTFVRFLSLYPHFASLLCLIMPNRLTQKISCEGTYSACILPLAMKHIGFASLIPKGPDYRAIRGYLSVAFTAFMVEFRDATNPPNKSNLNLQAKFAKQLRLTKIGIKKGRMSNDYDRIFILKVILLNCRGALESVLRVVGNVRRAHGMAVEEDPRLYIDENVFEGDVWKIGRTNEIECETGNRAAKAIKNLKKRYPDYGKVVMDHTCCCSSSTEVVDFPGLTGFSI